MIKIADTVKLVDGEQQYPVIERETSAIYQGRPICVGLLLSGVKVWQKRSAGFVTPYDKLFQDAQRGSFQIAARSGCVTQKTAAALINRDLVTALRGICDQQHTEAVNRRIDDARTLLNLVSA